MQNEKMNDEKYYVEYEEGETQYEFRFSHEYPDKRVVMARYIKQFEHDYKGNILIEALPPIRSKMQIYAALVKECYYDKNERKLPPEHKVHAIFRLLNVIEPTIEARIIAQNLEIILCRSYVGKRIMSPSYVRELEELSELVSNKDKAEQVMRDSNITDESYTQKLGFLISGLSGMGKTTAIFVALEYYPQLIIHKNVNQYVDEFKQIVWLKVNCPPDGSLKGICENIIHEIDALVKTNYWRSYKSGTANNMAAAVAYLVKRYAVGTIVIDEIHNLTRKVRQDSKKDEKKYEGLNFFTYLTNQVNVPIIYIATQKSTNRLFDKSFEDARRAMGIEDVEYVCMQRNEFDGFLEKIWGMQWTTDEVELTEEIKELFFKYTLGITDRIIKFYMLLQYSVIRKGKKRFTIKDIKELGDNKFKLTRAMMNAYANREYDKLEKILDMQTSDTNKMINAIKIENKDKLQEIYNNDMVKIESERQKVINALIQIGINVGKDRRKMEDLAKKIVKEHGLKKGQAALGMIMMEELIKENTNN